MPFLQIRLEDRQIERKRIMKPFKFIWFRLRTANKVKQLDEKQLIDFLEAIFNKITLEKDAVLVVPAKDGYYILGHSDQERGCPLCGTGDTQLTELKPKT